MPILSLMVRGNRHMTLPRTLLALAAPVACLLLASPAFAAPASFRTSSADGATVIFTTTDQVVSSDTDAVEIGEWRWAGTHVDGTPFAMCGVGVLGIEDGHVAWGRLYMEPVDRDDVDINQMVRETYRPPQ